MIELFVYPLLIAITGWVFTMILIQPGEIFGWYGWLISNIPSAYLRKPLGECEYCFAGQLAFWFYLVLYVDYWWLHHVFIVSLTIFVVEIINKYLGNGVEEIRTRGKVEEPKT